MGRGLMELGLGKCKGFNKVEKWKRFDGVGKSKRGSMELGLGSWKAFM